MAALTFKHFDQCQPNELVRFSDDRGTYWAVVGDRGRERLMLVVFPLNNAPYCMNIMGQMDILVPRYEATVVLSYGTQYDIRIDHAGDCEIGGAGKLINAPGAYVLTEEERFICCKWDAVATKIAYYNTTAGKVTSEPGSQRAVFAGWELIWTESDGGPPVVLFRVRANKTPIVAPVVTTNLKDPFAQ